MFSRIFTTGFGRSLLVTLLGFLGLNGLIYYIFAIIRNHLRSENVKLRRKQ